MSILFKHNQYDILLRELIGGCAEDSGGLITETLDPESPINYRWHRVCDSS